MLQTTILIIPPVARLPGAIGLATWPLILKYVFSYIIPHDQYHERIFEEKNLDLISPSHPLPNTQ